jgi:hypothetical protein
MRYLSLLCGGVLLLGCQAETPPTKGPANEAAVQKKDDQPAKKAKNKRRGKPDPPHIIVSAAAFSPDNKYLLPGYACIKGDCDSFRGEVQQLRLWDVASGKQLRSWNGQEPSTRFLAFLPNGKRALSSGGGYFRIWNIPEGREVKKFSADGISHAALSADGKRLFAYGEGPGPVRGSLFLWDVDRGALLQTHEYLSAVEHLSLSPGGKLAVMTRHRTNDKGGDITQQVWDVDKGQVVQSSKDLWWPTAFSTDGKSVIVSQGDFMLVRQVPSGRVVGRLPGRYQGSGIAALSFTPGNKSVVIARTNGSLKEVEVLGEQDQAEGKKPVPDLWSVNVLDGLNGPRDLELFVFSGDCRLGVAASPRGGRRPRLWLWDTVAGQRLRELTQPDED